jgi:uncharacterized protein (TIGR00730 family)
MKKTFHRLKRDSDLPWQHPKSPKDDPIAAKNLEKIMRSPSYKLAIDDSDFLLDEIALPARLELDYLKAEMALKKYGIKKTIVVYGSTRIVEPKVAERNLEKAEEKNIQNEIAKAKKIVEKSIYYEDARAFGRLVGESGGGVDDNRVVLMTGGGPGIMEAANRGAYDVGSKSIGLNITLPHEQYPNPYITPDLCFLFYYFAIRKMHFMKRASALVIYPGGFGTLDELFEALTLIQTRKMKQIPVVFVGEEYWSRVIDFDFLEQEGVINSEDLDLFTFSKNADDAWESIVTWYEESAESLFS